MSLKVDCRRTALTFLFAFWLSVQFVAVAMSPSWGFILPHDHITRGLISERAWQEHLREHRLGLSLAPVLRCDVPVEEQDGTVMGSFPEAGAAVSLYSFMAAYVTDARVKIPALNAPRSPLWEHDLSTYEISYSPPVPPPNL